MSNPTAASAKAGRFGEVDQLKAVGILAVILIHSIRAPWDPGISSLETWLGLATRFAVPAFLLCSGFLYATTDPIPRARVWQRIRRVLLPYLIASAGAQLWWLSQGAGRDAVTLLQEVLLGSSFGPYYYVFVHFWLVLFAPLFATLPRAALLFLTASLLVTQGVFESSPSLLVPIYWHIRNPLLWWGYFLVGWTLRLYYEPIRSFVTEHRAVLIAAALAAVALFSVLMSQQPRTAFSRAAMWLDTYAIIALVFVSTCGRGPRGRIVNYVADATFAIYLFHLFFIHTAELFWRPLPQHFDLPVLALYWGSGLFGSIVLVALARAALGPRSRDVIGA